MQTLQTSEITSEPFASPAAHADIVLPAAKEIVVSAPVVSAVPAAPVRPLAPVLPVGDSLQPILMADDDEDDVFFIQRLIKKTGVKNPIKVFDDGSEVVNYLGSVQLARAGGRRREPLLLFLDLNMRGLGGFGFLEWARQQKNLGLTIVVLSNSGEPEIVDRALELGAHRYLIKYPCVQTVSTIIRSVYPQTVF